MKKIFGMLPLLATLVVTAAAQEPATGKIVATGESAQISFWEIIERGGVVMYPLAALSFIAILLVVFYFLTIRQSTVVTTHFMKSAEMLVRKRDDLGLLDLCNRTDECIARITQRTIDFTSNTPSATIGDVREITEAEGTRQASILSQRITYLADIGAIAPMVGLLGTVFGMIKSFNEIAQDSFIGAGQIQLAGGVSEALITTAGGLIIGIPSLIFYSVFRGRVQRLISELEAASTHFLALFSSHYYRDDGTGGAGDTPSKKHPRKNRGAKSASGEKKLDPQGL